MMLAAPLPRLEEDLLVHQSGPWGLYRNILYRHPARSGEGLHRYALGLVFGSGPSRAVAAEFSDLSQAQDLHTLLRDGALAIEATGFVPATYRQKWRLAMANGVARLYAQNEQGVWAIRWTFKAPELVGSAAEALAPVMRPLDGLRPKILHQDANDGSY